MHIKKLCHDRERLKKFNDLKLNFNDLKLNFNDLKQKQNKGK